jgi:hypothetical protein
MARSATSESSGWRKSTFSFEGNCVEIRELPDGRVAIRNSGEPDGTPTAFTRADIDAFFKGVKAGEFDDLT